jgi:hypothetical protein
MGRAIAFGGDTKENITPPWRPILFGIRSCRLDSEWTIDSERSAECDRPAAMGPTG